MKMKCLYPSMVRGEVVKAGAILDLTDSELKLPVVKSAFVPVAPVDPTPAKATESGTATGESKGSPVVVAGLTRDQAIAKLQATGAKVKGNISNSDLIAIYNSTFANVGEIFR